MFSARSLILASLNIVPMVIFLAVGGYAIWLSGSFQWVWWLVPGCGIAAWVLAYFWKPQPVAERPSHRLTESHHWTPRDREAAQVVRNYQRRVEELSAEDLSDPQFYLRQTQALALDLAKLYHPKARDPLKHLTVPEILAAVRLAIDDVERWTLESLPGSRMLTIRHWQMLQSAPDWYNRLSNTAWLASVLLNPANIVRYYTAKWSWDPVTEQLQAELQAVLYLRFIRQVGYYLIEMNSGRLRGGADAYRAAFGRESKQDKRRPAEQEDEPLPVTIALVGQVSSEKSSLVNLLTGGTEATVDVLPETQEVRRYRCEMGDPPVTITLLDSPGYGEGGASEAQLDQIQHALEASDAALLVMDAHSPAREADRRTLEQLRSIYASQPHLKPPPVAGVLTHVDLLPPPLEWKPPYDWRTPESPKARSLHDAVEYVNELFGDSLRTVVPVCSDQQASRTWGIVEELLPALVNLLQDARSVSLLRAFEAKLDRHRWKILLKQVSRGGHQLLRAWVKERLQDHDAATS